MNDNNSMAFGQNWSRARLHTLVSCSPKVCWPFP